VLYGSYHPFLFLKAVDYLVNFYIYLLIGHAPHQAEGAYQIFYDGVPC
jgi:hypothetical protein